MLSPNYDKCAFLFMSAWLPRQPWSHVRNSRAEQLRHHVASATSQAGPLRELLDMITSNPLTDQGTAGLTCCRLAL